MSKHDHDFLNLDNFFAEKKRDVFFAKKNIFDLVIHKIKLAKIKFGLLGYIFAKVFRTPFLKYLNKNSRTSNQNLLSDQKTIVLPLAVKSYSFNDMSITVFLHVFYIDEIDRIFSYLKNLPVGYRLCITTDDDKKNQKIVESVRDKGIVDFRVTTCPNRGRDIAPMLIEYREEFDKCQYAIHIHTKKSPHDSELSAWSDYLYQNLLGSAEIVASILSIFKDYPKIGMIAPEHFYPLTKGLHLGWGKNYKACFELLRHMGVNINQHSKLNFPSGSMFWFRPETIKPLLNLNLRYEDFNEEHAQVDGTLAHAIERTFFYACEIAGFSWLNTTSPIIPQTKSTKVYTEPFILDAPQLLVGLNNSIKA